MTYIQTVPEDEATGVTEADVENLRAHGLSDADIADVVLAAAARCFFSTVLAALGAEPDAAFDRLDPDVREALTGRT
jgi:alkylhydroperoxidase family enzyme